MAPSGAQGPTSHAVSSFPAKGAPASSGKQPNWRNHQAPPLRLVTRNRRLRMRNRCRQIRALPHWRLAPHRQRYRTHLRAAPFLLGSTPPHKSEPGTEVWRARSGQAERTAAPLPLADPSPSMEVERLLAPIATPLLLIPELDPLIVPHEVHLVLLPCWSPPSYAGRRGRRSRRRDRSQRRRPPTMPSAGREFVSVFFTSSSTCCCR